MAPLCSFAMPTRKRLKIVNVAYPFAAVSEGAVGGAEQVLSKLDRALVGRGHESLVIAQAGSSTAGTLHPIDAVDGEITDAVRERIRRQVRERVGEVIARARPDVVHLHGIDFADYLPLPGPACLVTLHLPLSWYDPAGLRTARPRTWLTPVSPTQAATAPADLALDDPIPNGVAIPEQAEPKSDFVLTLGRVCREKGTHEAIEAARAADATLLVAGTVFPYPEHRRYWRERVLPRLDRARRWIGRIAGTRKQRLLGRAKCVLIPSRAPETSSLVAMEALASGTPVIAYRSGALPDIIEDGRTGFIVADASEMARAIASASRLDPEACRRAARERFPLEAMTSRYLERYRQLAA